MDEELQPHDVYREVEQRAIRGTASLDEARALVEEGVEIMAMPPMDRAEDNPWPEWPKVYKMDYGQEEAAAKFGADPRVYHGEEVRTHRIERVVQIEDPVADMA